MAFVINLSSPECKPSTTDKIGFETEGASLLILNPLLNSLVSSPFATWLTYSVGNFWEIPSLFSIKNTKFLVIYAYLQSSYW